MTKTPKVELKIPKMKNKHIKIIGGLLLIVAFGTQLFLFDYYSDKLIELANDAIGESLIDKGADLKEIKFFVAKEPLDSEDQEQYKLVNIRLAAYKLAVSEGMLIQNIDTPEEIIKNIRDSLKQYSLQVQNFNEYMNLINKINTINNIKVENFDKKIKTIINRKIIYRDLFAFSYIVGSALLLIPTFKEKD
jgi:hypothetical protein